MLAEGRPDIRLMLFPAAEVEMIDTWHVSGLRGTGSHDMEVHDAVVPASALGLAVDATRPREQGPLYAFPAVRAAGARDRRRHARDRARRARRPGRACGRQDADGSARKLAERPATQARVAQAEAALSAARALLSRGGRARHGRRPPTQGEVDPSAARRCGSRPRTPRPRRQPSWTPPTTSAAAPRSTRPARCSAASATCTPPRSTC